MKAVKVYWLTLVFGMLATVASGLAVRSWMWLINPVGIALTLTFCFLIVVRYEREQEIQLPKLGKKVKTQLIRWFWYNLLIFPVLMAFYIPYNVFWLQYSPIQILKFVATNGFFGAIVNFVLRPWNAWITRFIEKRSKRLNSSTMPSIGEIE